MMFGLLLGRCGYCSGFVLYGRRGSQTCVIGFLQGTVSKVPIVRRR